MRATSEPLDVGTSPENSLPQYSWEWGGFPVQTPLKSKFPERGEDMERATSMPPSGEHVHDKPQQQPVDGPGEEDVDIHFRRGGWLRPDDNGAYILEFKGRITNFDLSLCGDLSMAKNEEEAKRAFMQKRVPFQRFIDHPEIVHKDELCIYWRGR